jgi:type IV secretion system protein TrbL
MSCRITDPIGCISQLSGGAAKQIAGSAFAAIAHQFGQAADDAVNWLWGQMSAATAVTLGGVGWQTDIGITAALAVSIGLGLFVIQVITSVIRREPGGLARAGRGLLVAFVAGGAAIAVTNLLLAASDEISAGIVRVGAGTTIQEMGKRILAPATLASVTNSAVVMLVALAMIFATLVVWFALMLRKLLIIVAAVFAPVAFTGSLSDFTSSWVRKWVETTVALIVSKIILVTIFVVGLGVLEGGAGEASPTPPGVAANVAHVGVAHVGQSITQIVVGVLILLMAGFAPWLAIKLVHFAGDSFHAIHASAGTVPQGAQAAIDMPKKMSSLGQKASSNRLSSSSTSQSKSPSGPTNGTGAAGKGASTGATSAAGAKSPASGTPGSGGAAGGAASSAAGGVAAGGGGAAGGAAGSGGAAGGAGGAATGVVIAGQMAKNTIDTGNAKVADAANHNTPPPSDPPPATSGRAADSAARKPAANTAAPPTASPRGSG